MWNQSDELVCQCSARPEQNLTFVPFLQTLGLCVSLLMWASGCCCYLKGSIVLPCPVGRCLASQQQPMLEETLPFAFDLSVHLSDRAI